MDLSRHTLPSPDSTAPIAKPASRRSKYLRRIIILLVSLTLLFSGLFFLYVPVTIVGSDNSLLTNGQTYVYEKLTYLFRQPRVGDLVTFNPSTSPEVSFIGVIAKVIDNSEITSYIIVNKKNSTKPWIISRDKIVGHVYFPVFELPVSPNNLLPTPTPTLAPPTVTPTSTSTPRPTRIPTKIPTNTLAPTSPSASQTTNPSSQSSNNAFRCEVVTRAVNEGVPQTYNLIYSALNAGNDYVTGIQWDYNGDGSWDSDLSLANGNVNHTYSNPGIYTIRMKIQTQTGATTECSTQVAVQPH